VTLSNDATIKNSFAFRSGNTYIVSENGELSAFFGGNLPSVSPTPVPNPGSAYPSNQLYDFLNAQIQSRSTKVLASPTLILSENPDPNASGSAVAVAVGAEARPAANLGTATIGRPFSNESFVTVGTQVITNYAVQAGQNGAPNTCQPAFGTAGLTFGARMAKIDDNGFVTFALSPSVSAITGSQDVQGCGPINILSVRRLDTGSVRVRDGQTLILTGVISDSDSQAVTKWPILGDLPLIGQFFRGSSGTRQKSELVILVTPRIIDDTQGGSYGYGYRPSSTEAQRMLSGSM
jgi:type IV pilus assembly protein PilQ